MARFESGWVGGDDWYTRLDATVTNVNDTTARVTCKAYVVSRFGVMRNSTHCKIWVDGAESDEVTNASFGANSSKLLLEWSRDVARGTEDRKISVSAKIWAYYGPSSYATGATASGTVTISQRGYSKPNPPKDFSATRVSDSEIEASWVGDYTGMDGAKPWRSVILALSVNGGDPVDLETLSWDATNHLFRGLRSNSYYVAYARAEGAGGTSGTVSSETIYMTPSAPYGVELTKVADTTVRVEADTSGVMTATAYEVQTQLNGGGWSASRTVTAFPVDIEVGGGKVRARVRATRGELASDWEESDEIATVTPPLAPALSGLPSVAPTSSSQTLRWRKNHPDGTAQTAAQVEYTVGTTVKTADVSGSESTWTVPTSVMASACSVKVRVRTKGLHASWGAWSAPVSMRVAVPPRVVVTSPAAEDTVIDRLPMTIAWTETDSTGIASRLVEIVAASGAVVYSARPSGTSMALSAAQYLLADDSSYTIRVTVTGGSSLSAIAKRRFRTDYVAPAVPAASVAYDDKLAAHIAVSPGAYIYTSEGTTLVGPMSAEPDGVLLKGRAYEAEARVLGLVGPVEAESYSVSRLMPDGSQWLVADGLKNGQLCIDPLPPLNLDFFYLVTAYSSIGTTATRKVAARVDTGSAAFNFGAAAGECETVRCDPSWSRQVKRGVKLYDFADGGEAGGLPMAYTSTTVEGGGKQGFTVLDLDQLRRIESFASRYAVCWYRDLYGGRRRCAVSWDMSSGVPYDLLSVGASLTDVRFVEAW